MKQKLSEGSKAGYDNRVGAALGRGPNLRKKDVIAPWANTFPAPQATLDLDFANDRGFVRGVGQGRSMDAVTFTRASTGTYVDNTGTLQSATNNTPRFDWASTAQLNGNSLRYTEDPSKWSGYLTRFTYTGPDADEFFTLTNAVDTIEATFFLDQYSFGTSPIIDVVVYRSIEVRLGSNATHVRLGATADGSAVFMRLSDGVFVRVGGVNGTAPANNILKVQSTALTGGGWRIELWALFIGNATNLGNSFGFGVWNNSSGFSSGNTGHTCLIRKPIVALVRDINFRDSIPYLANGIASATNTPLVANPTCNGLLIEESRANRLLWCRDASNAAWVKTNVTAAKDQTGIDGVASAASSLTASADGGTCIQTITLASGSRTGSVYLKRITGTGNVQVTLDGSTWSTVDLSSTEWRRIVLSGTVTNPTVGIRLATNGDAVAMDYGQIEDGSFVTSPILTTTASVTRSADVASLSVANWYRFDEGTLFQECSTWHTIFGTNQGHGFTLFQTTTTNGQRSLWINSQTQVSIDVVSGSVPSVTVPTINVGTAVKAALGYRDNNTIYSAHAQGLSGSETLTGTRGLVPTTLRSDFGFGGGRLLNGWFKRVIYFPKRLPNDAINELTK